MGAGPGGLVAARVLQNKGHPESGQWPLIEAGLEAQFRALARAEGQDMRILDRSGKALWKEVSPPDLMSRPEVDRPALRDVRLDSLRPGTIRWAVRAADAGSHRPGVSAFSKRNTGCCALRRSATLFRL